MDRKELEKIFEICGFAQDPNYKLFEQIIFNDVEYPNLAQWNINKDNLIKRMLGLVEHRNTRVITSEKEFAKVVSQDGKSMRFKVQEPILIKAPKGIKFEGNSFGVMPIFMGKGVKFEEVVIHSPTYLQEGAQIEFSRMQAERRAQFLGYGAKLSNVSECRGLFVSGYKDNEAIPQGWQNTYLHATSVNNLIGGAGSDLCVGVNFMNHPEVGETSTFMDPIKLNTISTGDKKIPILFGMNASVGAGTLIDCATVVGANQEVVGIPRLKGLVVDRVYHPIPPRHSTRVTDKSMTYKSGRDQHLDI